MGPPKYGAPGNCPVCPPPLKPALLSSHLREVRSCETATQECACVIHRYKESE